MSAVTVAAGIVVPVGTGTEVCVPIRNDTVNANLCGPWCDYHSGPSDWMKHFRCLNAQISPRFLRGVAPACVARGSCNRWHCRSCWSFQFLVRVSNDVFVIFVFQGHVEDTSKLASSITSYFHNFVWFLCLSSSTWWSTILAIWILVWMFAGHWLLFHLPTCDVLVDVSSELGFV